MAKSESPLERGVALRRKWAEAGAAKERAAVLAEVRKRIVEADQSARRHPETTQWQHHAVALSSLAEWLEGR